jgi:predicted dehydrogenase
LRGEGVAVTRPFRTALVGVGRMGSSYADDPLTANHYRCSSHAQALAAHPAFAWEAAVDPDAAALAKAQTRWGFAHGVASIGDLVGLYAPEVLVLATPPSAYVDTVTACPELKAVLCEKPLGATLAEAREFTERCAARNILVQVNFWRRCDVFYRELAGGKLMATIGKPQAINGFYGNGLINNGSHLVDFCRMLFGEIADIAALGPPTRRGDLSLAGDFEVACRLGFANGGAAILQPLDFCRYREVGLDIWGKSGRLELLNEGLTNRLSPRAAHRALSGAGEIALDAPRAMPSTVGEALYGVYDNLADALRHGAELLSSAEAACRTACVIDAIERAAEFGDGRAVAVGDP